MDTVPVLPAIEIESSVPVRASIIWLHGLGADGHDFKPMASQLALPPDVGIRFVLPDAPHRPVTVNNGMVMRAWYDIRALDHSQGEDAEGIRESAAKIMALVEREINRGIQSHHIVLAGFSQGGAIALHAGLRSDQRLGGILALSTYLPLADRLAVEAEPVNEKIPVFMAHGTEDPVIALVSAEASYRQLRELGYRVQLHRYAMGHGLCLQEIQDIRAWLIRLFS